MQWIFRLTLRVAILLLVCVLLTVLGSRFWGATIVAVEINFQVFLVDMNRQVVQNVTPLDASVTNYSHPMWSPDGDRLAFFRWFPDEDTASIVVLDVWTGRWEHHNALASFPRGLSWSPDGDTIAFVRMDWPNPRELFNVAILDTQNGHVDILTRIGMVVEPGWSPDGDSIAFRAVNDLYTVNVSTSEVSQLTHERNTAAYTWSGDGQQIMTLSKFEGVRAQISTLSPDLPDADAEVFECQDVWADQYISWSPDTRYLLTHSSTGLYLVSYPDCYIGERNWTLGITVDDTPIWVDNDSFFVIRSNSLQHIHSDTNQVDTMNFGSDIAHISVRSR